ncbi:MAG TPA: hypothetical protein DDX85_10450, partial [Nitrospiraceae bacterium]|nr:hypothetical protein [Nitrospiraceae bacterium]
ILDSKVVSPSDNITPVFTRFDSSADCETGGFPGSTPDCCVQPDTEYIEKINIVHANTDKRFFMCSFSFYIEYVYKF